MTLDILEQFEMKFKESVNDEVSAKGSHKTDYEWKLVWRNVIIFIYIHVTIIYGLYVAFFYGKLWTFIWFYAIGVGTGFGVTAGAHRLWCHRSYKAKWPLRFILMILQTAAFQDDIYVWVRDHRVHHKFTDTNADPYNSKRGFFFSHIGWLMLRKHSEVVKKGATIDMSDIEQDPIVTFQRKWYLLLMLVCCFIVPLTVPVWGWNESLWYAWHMAVGRYGINLNITWSVNSFAHMYGVKPYDTTITPTDNASVSMITLGEGWHNYHHVFPWDYKAAEFGRDFSYTTALIEFCAYLGLAYDLKTASPEMVKNVFFKTITKMK
ncbi:acyl-CoA Delta(11) desaturase-like [Nylanderia fulva]|uniref:acyl-CoA Delta(11) desaturase-like n=1 Tax=Nylanderia fulva TaxID=613905 RepID=UPI0010FB2D28|nr:acyl-CoA Delta(11) desaturase-like [Nylanderia fulva]